MRQTIKHHALITARRRAGKLKRLNRRPDPVPLTRLSADAMKLILAYEQHYHTFRITSAEGLA